MPEVLLVDDDHDYKHQVYLFLQSNGILAQTAENAQNALIMLAVNSFSLLITDLNMPGMDGFALAQEARLIAPEMPIIMITGNINPDLPELAEQAGISKLFSKSFDSDDLLRTIHTLTTVVGGKTN